MGVLDSRLEGFKWTRSVPEIVLAQRQHDTQHSPAQPLPSQQRGQHDHPGEQQRDLLHGPALIQQQTYRDRCQRGGEDQPGCWQDFYIGDVHFILLDGRYYRDRKSGSMLGPVQKRWLKETLRRSEGTFKVIASPVPFTPGVKPGSPDPWDGYPEEREELFSFIASEGLEGVFLIAADRHRTDLRTTRRPDGYDLYEFESSRLTNRHVHREQKEAIFSYNEKQSFGLVHIDTSTADPGITYEVVNIDGEPVEKLTLRRSRLGW